MVDSYYSIFDDNYIIIFRITLYVDWIRLHKHSYQRHLRLEYDNKYVYSSREMYIAQNIIESTVFASKSKIKCINCIIIIRYAYCIV